MGLGVVEIFEEARGFGCWVCRNLIGLLGML